MTETNKRVSIEIKKVMEVINKFLTLCEQNSFFFEIVVKGEHGKVVYLNCNPKLNTVEDIDKIS